MRSVYWRAVAVLAPSVATTMASRTSSTVAARNPLGSAARKRCAVMAMLRRLWADLRLSSQDATGSSSLRARVALKASMRIAGRKSVSSDICNL